MSHYRVGQGEFHVSSRSYSARMAARAVQGGAGEGGLRIARRRYLKQVPCRDRRGHASGDNPTRSTCATSEGQANLATASLLRISFVIPVLNGERYIARCLEHIRREAGTEDETIVVDNGSTDRTLEIVRDTAGAAIIEAPGVTIAALRNRGAALARNEILAFIDADCYLCPGWRASLEHVLADTAV